MSQQNNAPVTLGTNGYSKSEQIFLKKAEKICKKEKRPFWLFDFEGYSASNYRQFIHKINRKTPEKIIKVANSQPALYKIEGYELTGDSHRVTLGAMSLGENYMDILESIRDVEPTIHDIKVLIKETTLHKHLVELGLTFNEYNHGIKVNFPDDDNNRNTTAIVYPNAITIHIGCSYKPLVVDPDTTLLLFEHLSRVGFYLEILAKHNERLPPVADWIITHQHLGKDGSFSISGQGCEFKFKDVNAGLIRFYAKKHEDGLTRPRLEQIQTPAISLRESMKNTIC